MIPLNRLEANLKRGNLWILVLALSSLVGCRNTSPENACDNHDVRACKQLASAYLVGDRVAENDVKAVLFFEKACDLGDAESCLAAAKMFHGGLGVGKWPDKAVKLYRKACDGGYAEGCAELARMFEQGEEVIGSDAKATQLYQKACDAGDRESCSDAKRMRDMEAPEPFLGLRGQEASYCVLKTRYEARIILALAPQDSEKSPFLVVAQIGNGGPTGGAAFGRLQLRDDQGRVVAMVPETRVSGYEDLRQTFSQAATSTPDGAGPFASQSDRLPPGQSVRVLLGFAPAGSAKSLRVEPTPSSKCN